MFELTHVCVALPKASAAKTETHVTLPRVVATHLSNLSSRLGVFGSGGMPFVCPPMNRQNTRGIRGETGTRTG